MSETDPPSRAPEQPGGDSEPSDPEQQERETFVPAVVGPDAVDLEALGLAPLEDEEDPWIGRRIGPYRLDSVLGRGGMGSVYAASRVDGTYHHQVAVKIVRWIFPGATAIQRFRQERQILARLEHPRIARILDGGVTEDKVPYLVMEKVEGDSICQAADHLRLPVAERVDLFIEVCRAVEAAHRRLVVHRDLKPENVLIDRERQVKLLDFGIAKLLDSEADAPEPQTRTDMVAMTPSYASPEQIMGEPIGTATDVYALGLILFELLAGCRAQQVTDLSPTGLFRTICEHRIPEPSVVIAGLSADQARQRADYLRTTPARLVRDVRGDLDMIVARCLRKEPERRYGSAGELAQDLERFRKGLPVEARPDSLAYRGGKFLGRHRVAVAAAALTLAALVAGLALAVGGMVRALEAERRTAAEAESARQTADFLVALFEVSDPKERSEEPSARVLLDRAAEGITGDLDASPEVRARLLGTLARVYDNLGVFDRAAEMYGEQIASLRDSPRPAPEAAAIARAELAGVLSRAGRYERAFTEASGALEELEDAGRSDSRQAGQAMSVLGIATWIRGDYPRAHELLERSLELRRRHQDPDAPWRVGMLNNLAILEVELGRTADARGHYEAALRLSEQLWGEDDVHLAPTLNNLALLEKNEGRLEIAEAHHRRALELRLQALGDMHPDVGESWNNLGDLLNQMGRREEARQLLEKARDLRVEVLGPAHPHTLTTRFNLAVLLRLAGHPADARADLEPLLPAFAEAYGEGHSYLSSLHAEMAELELQDGRPRAAREHSRRALEIRQAAHGPDHPLTINARADLERVQAALEASPAGVD